MNKCLQQTDQINIKRGEGKVPLTSSWCVAGVFWHFSSFQTWPPFLLGLWGCNAPPASPSPAQPSAALQLSHGVLLQHSTHNPQIKTILKSANM